VSSIAGAVSQEPPETTGAGEDTGADAGAGACAGCCGAASDPERLVLELLLVVGEAVLADVFTELRP
jgi:hypothetical protein